MNNQICPCCGKPKKPKDYVDVFAGHRYGLQALKPALEPIIVFQKPYAGRPIDCITATGAGCLNVDGGRIPASGDDVNARDAKTIAGKTYNENVYQEITRNGEGWTGTQGRWPANFYLDDEAARRLDEQSGERPSNGLYKKSMSEPEVEVNSYVYKGGWTRPTREQKNKYAGDTGGASRFFFRVSEQIDDADPVRYQAKASRRERDAGLEGFEAKPMQRHIRQSDGRANAGTYETFPARNPHPTVKPLALTRYLATLLLPPAEYAPRRIFIPFSGVGSEAIGAMQAGWEYVQGVEITEEYLPIAQARAEYWAEQEAQKQAEMVFA